MGISNVKKEWPWGGTADEYTISFWGHDKFKNWLWKVIQLCDCTKNHRVFYIKRANCMVLIVSHIHTHILFCSNTLSTRKYNSGNNNATTVTVKPSLWCTSHFLGIIQSIDKEILPNTASWEK